MPSRKTPLVKNELYHIYNRGVMEMPIFKGNWDYKHFIKTMIYYQIDCLKPRFSLFIPSKNIINDSKKTVNVICYCLMPNHFHFLLKQTKENGITEFMSKLSNSYTKHFNTKNKRVGPLLQGEFKSVHVGSNEQLVHLSRYIHLNPLVGYITKNLEAYPWSSYLEYTKNTKTDTCSKEIILNQFRSINDYKKFVTDQESYGRELEFIKHQLLDLPQV